MLAVDKGFVITKAWAFVIAAVLIVAVLLVLHVLSRGDAPPTGEPDSVAKTRRRGLKRLVVGTDGRTSTSKVQAVLWTLAVLYAFVVLLIIGRSVLHADCVDAEQASQQCTGLAKVPATYLDAFRDQVSDQPLQPEYFVLLGVPLSLAVYAKALVSRKTANGELIKGKATTEDQGVLAGVAQVVSDDEGDGDLVDTQYFLFTLVTLGYFVLQFVNHPEAGLPDLPPTLLALSGVAGAVYAAKKTVETSVRPAIVSVVPMSITAQQQTPLTIRGTGFGTTQGDVLVDGQQAAAITTWTDSTIVATAPALTTTAERSIDVQVVVPDGLPTDPTTGPHPTLRP